MVEAIRELFKRAPNSEGGPGGSGVPFHLKTYADVNTIAPAQWIMFRTLEEPL